MFTYRGQTITDKDIDFINKLISDNPDDSRWRLSKKLCQAWNWVQPNGQLRDMVCRSMMLELHRAGHIKLPDKKRFPANPLSRRKKPLPVEIDQTPVECRLSDIRPLKFRQVRRTSDEKLFNSLIQQFHYLGYCHPVGEQLKYMIYVQERPVACMAWSSAVPHIACRDRFIGWSRDTRMQNLRLMACNTRFLILPHVKVPHLASHILGRMARILPQDWSHIYNHSICYLETFVDTTRFAGTCYRAANWIYLGDTAGRSRQNNTKRPDIPIKAVWGYPLNKNFRSIMTGGAL